MEWFLYDNGLRHKRVHSKLNIAITVNITIFLETALY